MSEPKFTPKPWEIEISSGPIKSWRNIVAGSRTIAWIRRRFRNEQEEAANASLISAAPEMYAALEAIANDTELQTGFRPSELAAIDALLAKARGESPPP